MFQGDFKNKLTNQKLNLHGVFHYIERTVKFDIDDELFVSAHNQVGVLVPAGVVIFLVFHYAHINTQHFERLAC